MKSIQIEYNHKFEDECRRISEVGFKYITISFCNMDDYSDRTFLQAQKEIDEILSRYDLRAVQSHLYYYDLLISSEKQDEDKERQIKRGIELSGKLGIPWCVWHPRAHSSGGYSKELSFKDNFKQVCKYLEYAYKYNTGIALENLMSWPGYHMYGSEYEELAELYDSFNDQKIGICWDFGHANLMDFSQEDALRYLGKRIKCTHIHNNFKNYDLHLLPDSGIIEWEKLMPIVTEIGYNGPLTLETHYHYSDEEMIQEFYLHNFKCLEFLERLKNNEY